MRESGVFVPVCGTVSMNAAGICPSAPHCACGDPAPAQEQEQDMFRPSAVSSVTTLFIHHTD